MAFTNKYPYTDFHELNMDWILETINQLNVDIETVEEKATAAAIAGAKEYVDEEVAGIITQFNALKSEVDTLNNNFTSTVSTLRADQAEFISTVNAQVTILSNRIDAIRAEINADIIGVNARTDLAIQQNNDYIFDVIDNILTTQIKVTNYFTGEKVSIQSMFDYLAGLHVDNGATITDFANAAKTVTEIVNINETCTHWVLNGKTYLAA